MTERTRPRSLKRGPVIAQQIRCAVTRRWSSAGVISARQLVVGHFRQLSNPFEVI